MSVGRDSRFANVTQLVLVDSAGNAVENARIDLPYPRPNVSAQKLPDITTYTVRGDDSWQTLAQRFFRGRSDLWWAIAEFSGVVDPYTELNAGKTTPLAGGTLSVPTFETVVFDLIGT